MPSKYTEIARMLGAQAHQMRLNGATRLPSEMELADRFGCSRQTIRSALAQLEQQGMIIKRKGSGSYLSAHSHGNTIALLVPDQNEYLSPALISKVRQTLSRSGFFLTCYDTDNRYAKERAILEQLLEQPPAGVMLEPISNLLPHPNGELLSALSRKHVPIVSLSCAYAPSPACCITEDQFGGGYALVQHLSQKFRHPIGGFFRFDDSRGVERYRGCMQACLDLGLPFDEGHFFWFGKETHRAILTGDHAAFQPLLRLCMEGCSVVCQNDEIAYHLVQEAMAQQISVPEQLAVVSFDNSYYATASPIGITSLGHQSVSVGERAAKAMLDLLCGVTPALSPAPWHLSVRESG